MISKTWLLLLSAICAHSAKFPSEYRLGDAFSPATYDLNIVINNDFAQTKTFIGEVTIMVKPKDGSEPTHLLLHKSEKLDITSVTINGDVAQNSFNATTEILKINWTSPGANGQQAVKITYNGQFSSDMYGFYIKQVKTNEYIAMTQFAPTFARRAFPCFDEPQFKAKFKVKVTTPSGYHALSNQPNQLISIGNVFQFEETPKMSTYLLSIVVSKLKEQKIYTVPPTMSIWANREDLPHLGHALEVSKPILDNLNNLLTNPSEPNPPADRNIQYDKMGLNHFDQVVLPDAAFNAMENWGLTTYRERNLLFSDQDSTTKDRELVTKTIAHEFAHYWFGNLVTTKWWNSTWLNEGFATYFQYFRVANMRDYQLDKQFVVDEMNSIMVSDGFEDTVSLNEEVEVGHVLDKFGDLSYKKGASLIRMIGYLYPEEDFMKILNKYLVGKKNDVVEPNDFISLLDLPNGLTDKGAFSESISKWFNQPGYPVVYVERDGNLVKLSQKPFTYTKTEDDDRMWLVPIAYQTIGKAINKMKYIIPNDSSSINVESGDLVIVNPERRGYYRVNYDKPTWLQIISQLKTDHTKIDELTRSVIIDDAFNLARGGQLEYSTLFNLLEYLTKERSYYPWKSAFDGFEYLRTRLLGNTFHTHLTALITTLIKPIHKEITAIPATKPLDIYTKQLVLNWACDLGLPDCIKPVIDKKFAKSDANTVEPNLREVVYCNEIKSAQKSWDDQWALCNTAMVHHKMVILRSLGCTNNTTILKEYLQKSLGADVRSQDGITIFKSVLNAKGIEDERVALGFEFLNQKYTAIEAKYASFGAMGDLVMTLANHITTNEQYEQFNQLVIKHKIPSSHVLKSIATNLEWTKTNQKALSDYFTSGTITVTPHYSLLLLVTTLSVLVKFTV